MIINEYFKDAYLTCGKTRDNFMFAECPIEFIEAINDYLTESSADVKSCVIKITRKQEEKIEKTLSQFEHDIQKNFIARDYICSLIMLEILKGVSSEREEVRFLRQGIKAILHNDYLKVREFNINSPRPKSITNAVKRFGKIELNVILIDTKNTFLQRAINNFLSSREPYSIKIFTTNRYLPSYHDELGTLIECPHDYMRCNIKDYVQIVDEFDVN